MDAKNLSSRSVCLCDGPTLSSAACNKHEALIHVLLWAPEIDHPTWTESGPTSTKLWPGVDREIRADADHIWADFGQCRHYVFDRPAPGGRQGVTNEHMLNQKLDMFGKQGCEVLYCLHKNGISGPTR